MYQLRKIDFRKGQVLAPIMSGIRNSETAGIEGNEEKEDHRHAVHGESLL